MTITPVQADGERITHFIAIKQDISERKRAEEEIKAATIAAEQAREDAEQANKAKDQFLATLSHELRTPLTPVLAAVQLLQREEMSQEKRLQHLSIIERNVLLEATLIDDLLDLTRIVRGKISLDRRVVSIGSIVERVVDICMPDILARNLHLDVYLDNGGRLIDGDVTRLQQVLWNILKNAIKFTSSGGQIVISCGHFEKRVVLSITDTGMGIEPEGLTRIFNAFEQGGSEVTREFGGLGLGLAITKQLVEMHGGTIVAKSEGKGRGATFEITLPEVAGEVSKTEVSSSVFDHSEELHRILLVEDHADTALLMTAILKGCGYEVETASSISHALSISDSHDFDLLISDLGLPDGSGHDLMRELNKRGTFLKGIAMSGFGRDEDVERSRESGFSAHLTKPVDLDTLVRKIGEIG